LLDNWATFLANKPVEELADVALVKAVQGYADRAAVETMEQQQ